MDDCSICFETITASTGHCTLGCAHTFHTACIGRWTTQTTASCPLCRKELGETEVLPKAPIIPMRQNTDTGQLDQYISRWIHGPHIVQIDARSGLRIIHNESSPRIHIGNGISVLESEVDEVMSLGRVSRSSAILALRENEGNVAEALYDLDHTPPVDEDDEPEPPPRSPLEPTDDMFTAWAMERLFTKGTIIIRNYHRFGSMKDIEERQEVMTFRHGFWVHPEYNDIVTIRRSRSF